jgi:hypothetical protein
MLVTRVALLTFVRSQEVRFAKWIAVLQELKPLTGYSDKIFPQTGSRKCMSDNTIGRMLIRLGYQSQQTMHGFRASARSLLSESGCNESALGRRLAWG